MSTAYTKLSLSEMLLETEALAAEAQQSFGQLNAQQLNWKPGADSWSVAQCLEHLIVINREMFSPMDEILGEMKRPRFLERLPVLPGLFGKIMIKAVAPNGKQKFKAPPTAAPSASAIDAQIVSQFTAHQREVASRIAGVERLGVERLVMTSPFVSFITYSLLDACRIIVAHERRHLAQAQRVLATPGFPR